jgi:hypothetical protein
LAVVPRGVLSNCWAAAAKLLVRNGFRFKNKLLSLDATLIELCASVFDWAQYRRTKGAVKLHLLLDHQGLLPSFALVTEGRVHESRVARTLRFDPGAIVVFDRGYTDYAWFSALDAGRRLLRHPHERQRPITALWNAAPCLSAAPSSAMRSSFYTNWPSVVRHAD